MADHLSLQAADGVRFDTLSLNERVLADATAAAEQRAMLEARTSSVVYETIADRYPHIGHVPLSQWTPEYTRDLRNCADEVGQSLRNRREEHDYIKGVRAGTTAVDPVMHARVANSEVFDRATAQRNEQQEKLMSTLLETKRELAELRLSQGREECAQLRDTWLKTGPAQVDSVAFMNERAAQAHERREIIDNWAQRNNLGDYDPLLHNARPAEAARAPEPAAAYVPTDSDWSAWRDAQDKKNREFRSTVATLGRLADGESLADRPSGYEARVWRENYQEAVNDYRDKHIMVAVAMAKSNWLTPRGKWTGAEQLPGAHHYTQYGADPLVQFGTACANGSRQDTQEAQWRTEQYAKEARELADAKEAAAKAMAKK